MLSVMQIGYGYWGNNVAKKLLTSGMFRFVCLAEQDERKRETARKNLPESVAVTEDYHEWLDRVEAVVICTQTQFSYDIAVTAMEQGKHVFTEKPLAVNVEKAEKLVAKAEEKQVVLHCDHLMVYNPVIRYIKNMIDSGELGDIMYIDVSRVNLGPIRKDINAMLDLAVHDIAVIDYLVDGLVPDRLNAVGSSFFGKQETITYLTMKRGNLLININSSWISPVKIRRTMIAGTKKMVIFDDMKNDKLRVYDSGIDVQQGDTYGNYEYLTRAGNISIPHITNEDSLQNSIEYFGECVRTGRESLSGPKQSLRVMNILERAQESLKY